MAQPLLPGNTTDGDTSGLSAADAHPQGAMNDLRIFWGPEICRLEYLLHLLDTGRVKDDSHRRAGTNGQG
jgi:hypothetical protein